MPRAHRNLHSLKPGSSALPWSYYLKAGDRVRGADYLMLQGVTPKHPSGKKFEACHAGTGNRSVFAWLKCERLQVGAPARAPEFMRMLQRHIDAGTLARLSLDPTSAGRNRFFHVGGQKYMGSERVYLCPDGSAYTSTENAK